MLVQLSGFAKIEFIFVVILISNLIRHLMITINFEINVYKVTNFLFNRNEMTLLRGEGRSGKSEFSLRRTFSLLMKGFEGLYPLTVPK